MATPVTPKKFSLATAASQWGLYKQSGGSTKAMFETDSADNKTISQPAKEESKEENKSEVHQEKTSHQPGK